MKHCLAILSFIALAGVLAAVSPAPNGDASRDPHAVVRGMTVSCHGSGRIWGTDAMVEAMTELKSLGVNWIAIHPYAGIGADGTVGGRRINRMYGDDLTWLTRPIEEAHKLGLKIMIKPHIAYWGSPFSWRGEIRFETEVQWERFFSTYTRWITMVAEICAEADGFAVGTELDGTVQFEQEWRDIIAAVRAKTDAPLTYSANWDSYRRVPFWDALDVIGIQSYFPLVNHEDLPTEQELERGWKRVLDELERYAKPFGKKVLLGELGYNNSALAARMPWDHRTGGPNAEEVQRRCMDVALEAIDEHDTVVGAFLWKWFPRARRGGRNFLMSTPTMRQVIAAHWRRSDERRYGE